MTEERMAQRQWTVMGAGLGLALAVGRVVRRTRAADFTGKVALITGGSRGLGLLLAHEFANQGCKVVICARDAQELEQAAKQLRDRGAEVMTVVCDVTDQSAVQRMVDQVIARFGTVDILVNNAGTILVGPLESTTVDDFRMAMDVMFWGVLYTTLAVLPQMRKCRSGWIINITSIGGKISTPHLLPYGCAKFAATGLSEGLRAELLPEGISVTTIAPGLLRNGSFQRALFKGRQEQEYALFSPMAALPLISMNAQRAARQIVGAARRGESERVLSTPFSLAARFHGLFPGTTATLLGFVDRALPGADGPSGLESGKQVDRRLNSRLVDALTALGRRAGQKNNE